MFEETGSNSSRQNNSNSRLHNNSGHLNHALPNDSHKNSESTHFDSMDQSNASNAQRLIKASQGVKLNFKTKYLDTLNLQGINLAPRSPNSNPAINAILSTLLESQTGSEDFSVQFLSPSGEHQAALNGLPLTTSYRGISPSSSREELLRDLLTLSFYIYISNLILGGSEEDGGGGDHRASLASGRGRNERNKHAVTERTERTQFSENYRSSRGEVFSRKMSREAGNQSSHKGSTGGGGAPQSLGKLISYLKTLNKNAGKFSNSKVFQKSGANQAQELSTERRSLVSSSRNVLQTARDGLEIETQKNSKFSKAFILRLENIVKSRSITSRDAFKYVYNLLGEEESFVVNALKFVERLVLRQRYEEFEALAACRIVGGEFSQPNTGLDGYKGSELSGKFLWKNWVLKVLSLASDSLGSSFRVLFVAKNGQLSLESLSPKNQKFPKNGLILLLREDVMEPFYQVSLLYSHGLAQKQLISTENLQKKFTDIFNSNEPKTVTPESYSTKGVNIGHHVRQSSQIPRIIVQSMKNGNQRNSPSGSPTNRHSSNHAGIMTTNDSSGVLNTLNQPKNLKIFENQKFGKNPPGPLKTLHYSPTNTESTARRFLLTKQDTSAEIEENSLFVKNRKFFEDNNSQTGRSLDPHRGELDFLSQRGPGLRGSLNQPIFAKNQNLMNRFSIQGHNAPRLGILCSRNANQAALQEAEAKIKPKIKTKNLRYFGNLEDFQGSDSDPEFDADSSGNENRAVEKKFKVLSRQNFERENECDTPREIDFSIPGDRFGAWNPSLQANKVNFDHKQYFTLDNLKIQKKAHILEEGSAGAANGLSLAKGLRGRLAKAGSMIEKLKNENLENEGKIDFGRYSGAKEGGDGARKARNALNGYKLEFGKKIKREKNKSISGGLDLAPCLSITPKRIQLQKPTDLEVLKPSPSKKDQKTEVLVFTKNGKNGQARDSKKPRTGSMEPFTSSKNPEEPKNVPKNAKNQKSKKMIFASTKNILGAPAEPKISKGGLKSVRKLISSLNSKKNYMSFGGQNRSTANLQMAQGTRNSTREADEHPLIDSKDTNSTSSLKRNQLFLRTQRRLLTSTKPGGDLKSTRNDHFRHKKPISEDQNKLKFLEEKKRKKGKKEYKRFKNNAWSRKRLFDNLRNQISETKLTQNQTDFLAKKCDTGRHHKFKRRIFGLERVDSNSDRSLPNLCKKNFISKRLGSGGRQKPDKSMTEQKGRPGNRRNPLKSLVFGSRLSKHNLRSGTNIADSNRPVSLKRDPSTERRWKVVTDAQKTGPKSQKMIIPANTEIGDFKQNLDRPMAKKVIPMFYNASITQRKHVSNATNQLDVSKESQGSKTGRSFRSKSNLSKSSKSSTSRHNSLLGIDKGGSIGAEVTTPKNFMFSEFDSESAEKPKKPLNRWKEKRLGSKQPENGPIFGKGLVSEQFKIRLSKDTKEPKEGVLRALDVTGVPLVADFGPEAMVSGVDNHINLMNFRGDSETLKGRGASHEPAMVQARLRCGSKPAENRENSRHSRPPLGGRLEANKGLARAQSFQMLIQERPSVDKNPLKRLISRRLSKQQFSQKSINSGSNQTTIKRKSYKKPMDGFNSRRNSNKHPEQPKKDANILSPNKPPTVSKAAQQRKIGIQSASTLPKTALNKPEDYKDRFYEDWLKLREKGQNLSKLPKTNAASTERRRIFPSGAQNYPKVHQNGLKRINTFRPPSSSERSFGYFTDRSRALNNPISHRIGDSSLRNLETIKNQKMSNQLNVISNRIRNGLKLKNQQSAQQLTSGMMSQRTLTGHSTGNSSNTLLRQNGGLADAIANVSNLLDLMNIDTANFSRMKHKRY